MTDYLHLNKANWNERAPLHAASADYGLQTYADDPAFLSPVVRFDLPRLGTIAGQRGIHLQCHIGTDTLSLSRLGAHMTGLDFSSASIAQARQLAQRCGADIAFVESDVYAAGDVLPTASFDLVYTGVGALCWLPSIARWAATVSTLLKPGGRLFIREGHPVLWSIDQARQDALVIDYPYFETAQPMVWTEDTTYVSTNTRLQSATTHQWNHGLGEIVNALLAQGLQLTSLEEHDTVPWEALPGQMSKADVNDWRLARGGERLPLSYTLQAVKRAD
jgi:SAM-dependent methyltransferase